MTSSRSSPEREQDISTSLDQAEIHITNNNFAEALTILRYAQPVIKQKSGNGVSLPSTVHHRYMQLQALCRIQLAYTSGKSSTNSLEAWWHVFGLENQDHLPTFTSPKTTATTANRETLKIKEFKRQYKRLAILIHPDKCALPCAQDAFHKLRQGMDALIESVEGSERARKKRKHDNDDDEGEDGEGETDLSEEETEQEEEFAWWTEWDNPYPGTIPNSNTGAAGGQGLEAQQQKEEADAEAKEKDLIFLSALDTEKLTLEVRARQDAMLSRPPPECTIHDMKAALLRARTILNSKLEEGKQQANESGGGGGFLL